MTTDLRDPSRYLSGGELVLTGLAWRRDAGGLGAVRTAPGGRRGRRPWRAGEAELGHVPDDLVAACARHRLPLFAVHESVAFAIDHRARRPAGVRGAGRGSGGGRRPAPADDDLGPGGRRPRRGPGPARLRPRPARLGPLPRRTARSRARRSPAPPRPPTCARRWRPSIWRRPAPADAAAAPGDGGRHDVLPLPRSAATAAPPRRAARRTYARPCCPTGCSPSRRTPGTGRRSGSICSRASPS